MKKYVMMLILGALVCPSFAETAHQAAQLRTGKDFMLRFKVDRLIENIANEPENKVRDPFWPVGYVPEGEIPEPMAEAAEEVPVEEGLTEEDQAAIKAKLRTTGVMKRGNKEFAVVNNQMVGVGDIVKVVHKGETYQFEVRGFKHGAVVVETHWEDPAKAPQKEQEENNESEENKS